MMWFTRTICPRALTADTGATQGIFAVESAVNELADRLGMDPVKLRERNMVRQGEIMPSYYNELNSSCALDRCMARAKEMMHWDEKFPARDMGNGKIRSVGVAMAMPGFRYLRRGRGFCLD